MPFRTSFVNKISFLQLRIREELIDVLHREKRIMKVMSVKLKFMHVVLMFLFLSCILIYLNKVKRLLIFPGGTESSVSATLPKIQIVIAACGKAEYGVDALLTIKSIMTETIPHSAELSLSIVWDESHIINNTLVEPIKNLMSKFFSDSYVHFRFIPTIQLPTNFEVPFGKCASQRLFFPENPYFNGVDSLIYVDTDVLFLRSPLELWSEFSCFSSQHHTALANESNSGGGGYYRKRLSRNHVACSKGSCECKNSKRDCKRFHGLYGLNSGVVLMNLTRIRKTDFQARVRITMKKFHFFGDQDVYNHLFAEKDEVYVLPCIWNVRSDSRCNVASGIGILHGNRKLFHRIPDFSQAELRSLENFTSNYHRIRESRWEDLKPHCPDCSSEGALSSRCF